MCVYIYTHIYLERVRERHEHPNTHTHIDIYIETQRELQASCIERLSFSPVTPKHKGLVRREH